MLRSRPGCLVLNHRVRHYYYFVKGSKLRKSEATLLGKRGRKRSVKLNNLLSPVGEQAFIFPFKNIYGRAHLFLQSSQ